MVELRESSEIVAGTDNDQEADLFSWEPKKNKYNIQDELQNYVLVTADTINILSAKIVGCVAIKLFICKQFYFFLFQRFLRSCVQKYVIFV